MRCQILFRAFRNSRAGCSSGYAQRATLENSSGKYFSLRLLPTFLCFRENVAIVFFRSRLVSRRSRTGIQRRV